MVNDISRPSWLSRCIYRLLYMSDLAYMVVNDSTFDTHSEEFFAGSVDSVLKLRVANSSMNLFVS